MRKLILLILLVFLSAGTAFSADISDILDEMIYMDLQVDTINTNMSLWIWWFTEDKEEIKEASESAIKNLDQIADKVLKINLPEENTNLKDTKLQFIERLKKIYNGIESKTKEEINKEYDDFNILFNQYARIFYRLYNQYNDYEMPENFDLLNEHIKFSKNEEDSLAYREAYKLVKRGEHLKAYEILIGLKDKNKQTSFGDCISLLLSDCLLMVDSEIRDKEGYDGHQEGRKLLKEISEGGRYSPVVFEAFYKWRTQEQLYNYGMSNMSEIPNDMYNEKRWKLVNMLKQHSAGDPKDYLARVQIAMLLQLENITRGGVMGNNNLVHWGKLYAMDYIHEKGVLANNEKQETSNDSRRALDALRKLEETKNE